MPGAGAPRPPATFTPGEQRTRLTRLEALQEAIERGVIQDDPDGLAPERIVVFETNAPVQRILKAAALAGFPHFQELQDIEDDNDAEEEDSGALAQPDVRERRAALYVGLPNDAAVRSLVTLYQKWKAGERQEINLGPFNELFKRLVDVRLWGPRDRLNDQDLDLLRARVRHDPDAPLLIELELWPTRPARDPTRLLEAAQTLGAQLVDRANIAEDGFAYQALLVEIPGGAAATLVESLRDSAIGRSEDVYSIGPASSGQTPRMAPARPTPPPAAAPFVADAPLLAVLIDGSTIPNHALLRGGVVVEDLFDRDGAIPVSERRHATAMASIILRGDLRGDRAPLAARLLSIPLLADRDGAAISDPRRLLLDQMHRALRRAMLGDEQGAPSAPDAFVVNLSIGVADRVFANRASGLARLLDWWSFKHGVLFVIAAGNCTEHLLVEGVNSIAFEDLDVAARATATGLALIDAAPRRALLAPAECVNGLTVGASASSSAPAQAPTSGMFHPYDGTDAPSIISRSGFGARGALKPDVLSPGGRPRARITAAGDDTRLRVMDVFREEDALVAAAPPAGVLGPGIGPSYGTSPAAAAVTRLAVQTVLGLETEDGPYPDGLSRRDRALLAKALIAHSAGWGETAGAIANAVRAREPDTAWQHWRSGAARLVGWGAADPVRAVASDDNRSTSVGLGEVRRDKGVVFSVPLPDPLNVALTPRRLLLTLAWFSPMSPWRSKHALARLQGDIVGAEKIGIGAAERFGANEAALGPPPHFGRRSSVWSASFFGERAVPIGPEDNLEVRVSCFADPLIDQPVPFALAVTFETEAGVAIYQSVANRLRIRPAAPA